MARLPMAVAAVCAASAMAAPAFAGPLTPLETQGKQIYLRGEAVEGRKVQATLGDAGIALPATALPCVNCHGHDGLGRPEGGVRPSNVTWAYLTKPYGHHHPTGRRHPAYDESTVASAVTEGRDPAGNLLGPEMPRYGFSARDLAALIAYLKRLETDLDPGLSDASVRVGSIAPATGRLEGLGRAVTATIEAYFQHVNRRGGIFGRRIELELIDRGGGAVAEQQAAGIFAVVGSVATDAERGLFPTLENDAVPLVGPFGPLPDEAEAGEQEAFFLLSGPVEQSRALVEFAAVNLGLDRPKSAVVLAAGPTRSAVPQSAVPRAIERQARRRHWPAPAVIQLPEDPAETRRLARDLKAAGVAAVFFLAPADGLRGFAAAAAGEDWGPHLLLPGSRAGRAVFDLPAAFDGRVFLAYPSVPADQRPSGLMELEALRKRHGIPRHHAAARALAHAVAKVFVEGLRRSGRSLSRSRLVASLEDLHRFDTGLTPPISFGRNRRVGALGAYVVGVDLANRRFRGDATWVPLD